MRHRRGQGIRHGLRSDWHNMTRLRKVHRVLSTAHSPGVFSGQATKGGGYR